MQTAGRAALCLIATAIVLTCALGEAQARRGLGSFGESGEIICKQDVALTDPQGQPLCLALHNVYHYVVAGTYTTSQLVLGLRSENGYHELPVGRELELLQQSGLLPNPLPSYSRPAMDYVRGYSLWLILVIAAPFAALHLSRRRSAAALQR